jgi:hypothetical protein
MQSNIDKIAAEKGAGETLMSAEDVKALAVEDPLVSEKISFHSDRLINMLTMWLMFNRRDVAQKWLLEELDRNIEEMEDEGSGVKDEYYADFDDSQYDLLVSWLKAFRRDLSFRFRSEGKRDVVERLIDME